jgi:hypothetical protein
MINGQLTSDARLARIFDELNTWHKVTFYPHRLDGENVRARVIGQRTKTSEPIESWSTIPVGEDTPPIRLIHLTVCLMNILAKGEEQRP